MLTLSRRVGESLMLNDDIEVIVKDIHRNQVSISVRAPSDGSILWNELYEQKKLAMKESV